MTIITEHVNVERLRAGSEAFARADMEAMGEYFEPDVVWHVATPTGTIKPEYRGIDAMIGYFTELFAKSNGTLKLELERAFADDTMSVGVYRVTADRGEARHLDTHLVMVFDLHDGKTLRATEFASDIEGMAAFWA